MLEHHKAQGFLPIWTAWNQENYCMIGNHAILVITDAYIKGISDLNAKEELVAMVKSTNENHLNSEWDIYTKYGYYPFDLIDNESVFRTLERGYYFFCVALIAEFLGKDSLATTYTLRSNYYKNLFDIDIGLMRGRNAKGEYRMPFKPLSQTSPLNNPRDYSEVSAWQYSRPSTQHDVQGLIDLLGGKDQFTK